MMMAMQWAAYKYHKTENIIIPKTKTKVNKLLPLKALTTLLGKCCPKTFRPLKREE